MTASAPASESFSQSLVLNALPHPIVLVGRDDAIAEANIAAETFLQTSVSMLRRSSIRQFVPFGSPLLALIEQVRERDSSVIEYRVDIGTPRIAGGRVVDVYAAPGENGSVVLMLQERSMAEKIDRQLTHRGAARTVTGLAAMLAHEIKNPLSGIRGAAQLLESVVEGDDLALTRLICDEADRIVKLVDRMEVFSDDRPIERAAVNIHVVLERVKRLAQSGFAQHIDFKEDYDPSLPPVFANRDHLVQVVLNLIKNAAEAIGDRSDGEISVATAYRPGVRMSVQGSPDKVSLPIEFTIRDNGPGVSPEIVQHLFDPFVTTKPNGTGLGLALVAKTIGNHGGVIECDGERGGTVFRVLLPAFSGGDEPTSED
ncbi:MAG: two-component system sensor histidine kinase NtrB [Alphaproteobacteria bacterium]